MIHWELIQNGAAGFEALAVEYVSAEYRYPCGKWRHTPQTRDGNKDAYTIIIGYHPYVDQNETWWMEAKYSEKGGTRYLSRFRLDATIVSSLFHRKVTKIIFVTNFELRAKTISDIRVGLQRAIGCQEVRFATKSTLEYWLSENPDIYSRYFPPPALPAEKMETLFVSEDIDVYPYPGTPGETEKCTSLYMQKTYQAYFKLVSDHPRQIQLKSAQKGIKILSPAIDLPKGESPVCVLFRLTEKFCPYCEKEDGTQRNDLSFFKLENGKRVLLAEPIDILKNTELRLSVQSQNEIVAELRDVCTVFCKRPQMKISFLYGESGIGKTYIIQRVMEDPCLRNRLVFYHNFSEDHLENARNILSMVFFAIFPYLSSKDMEPEYLEQINEHAEISPWLIQFAQFREQPAVLEQKFQEYCDARGTVFPNLCEYNPRFIFLDNIQNLDQVGRSFLLSLLRETQNKKYPFFWLLSGQNYVLELDFYLNMRQMYPIQEYECVLDHADIISNIKAFTSFNLEGYGGMVEEYFPNLIILINFLKYVGLHPLEELDSLGSFLLIYAGFVNGNMGEELVLESFSNTLANQALSSLCKAVYMTPNGISVAEKDVGAAQALLQSGLVKLDQRNRLIPFHDIYVGIFRRAYQISKRELNGTYVGELDELRDHILFPSSPNDIVTLANRVTALRNAGRFRSVCYILGPYFEHPRPNISVGMLKTPYHEDVYYQLYFDYAYATVNSSRSRIGYDCFETIYREIKNKTSNKSRLLKLKVLFELMNSDYNILHFDNAMGWYMEFQKTFSQLIRWGAVSPPRSENEMYVLCENMRILIQSARGKKRSEQMFLRWREILKNSPFPHQYIDFHVRYAHTLYTIDPKRALRYTKEAYDLLPNEADSTNEVSKQWCLVNFQYYYLRILTERDFSLLSHLEETADRAQKDFYSSYRHRNLALCGILYMRGDAERADERFLRDMTHPRHLRSKLKGFYYEILALHHLFRKEPLQAEGALEQAAIIFETAPSYLRIVRHNRKVLHRGLFSTKRIDFCLGEPLKRDWYYVDPRAD